MSAMASQITSFTIVYLSVYSGADQRKHQISASLASDEGNSPVNGEFPAQMASNADNVSISWRHHEKPWGIIHNRCADFNIRYAFFQCSVAPGDFKCHFVDHTLNFSLSMAK